MMSGERIRQKDVWQKDEDEFPIFLPSIFLPEIRALLSTGK